MSTGFDQWVRVPLRTLEALHLAVAKDRERERVATADGIMASAARSLGLEVAWFF